MVAITFCATVGILEAQTTMVASDNFNRPNGPIGTNWADPAASQANFIVTNDTATPDTPNEHTEAYWTSNSFNDDQYSQVILTSIGAWTGVILRADTNQDLFYMGFVFAVNDYRIYAQYDGNYYSLATGSALTWRVGDKLKLVVSGSANPVTITMYQNDTPVLIWRSTGAEPFPVKTGGSPGIGIYSPAGDYLTIDSWEGGNLNPDTNAPTIPANLVASVIGPSQINLSWTPSTDDVEVVGYVVERSQGAGSTDFTRIAIQTGTNYSDTGLTPAGTYNYCVMALDAAGNLSESNEVTAITPIPPLPTISAIPDQTTLVGISVGPFPFTITDPGVGPSLLSATVTSSNTNLVPDQNLDIFNLTGNTQTLTITPMDGQTGTSTITITTSNGVNGTNISFLVTVNPPGGGTTVFANPSNIVIPASSIASPYPSTIDVSGEVGTITNITVTLHGMNHSYPGNVSVLLVGPGGQAVVLMSGTVGDFPMMNITFTLSDQAYYPLPVDSPMLDGTFQPTDTHDARDHTTLGVFDGHSPNGTWSLYVYDGGIDNGGQISGGWSLAITTVSPPTISGLTNQSTLVNTPTAAIPFKIGDAQTPGSSLVLTAKSSDPTVVNPASDIMFGGSDTNRTITLMPEPNKIGMTTISVIVTDDDGMSATNSFLMTVNQGQLNVTGIAASNKPYDGTTNATLDASAATLTGQGLTGSDVTLITSGASGAFLDPNVGTDKAVQITGLTLNGTDAGNYELTEPTTSANITKTEVTISSGLSVNSKAYDGTSVATLSSNAVVLAAVLAVDTGNVSVSTNGYVANFAGANVGTNIAVTVGGLGLTGNAAGNYTLSQPTGLSAIITPATLTVSAVNQSKTYGLPNPPLTVSYSGFVNNEGTNVLTGTPSLSTGATINSPPGPYPIMAGAGTLSAANYTFNLVNGTLTVVALPQLSGVLLSDGQLVLIWPTIANQSYQLESTTNLIAAAWTPVGDSVMGTGSPIVITNSLDVSPQLFFRLAISP